MMLSLKRNISTRLNKFLPNSIYLFLQNSWRILRYDQYRTLLALQKNYIKENNLVVESGPFKGMQYISDSVGSILLPKLLGTYEFVLHKKIEEIINFKPKTLIDIGVAEGYYLIGIGKLIPNTTLVGFDIDEKALSLTQKLYKKNGLENNLFLEKKSTPKKLLNYLTERTVIICDIEGHENDVLDPAACPSLKNVDYILVETHDIYVKGTTKKITGRFKKTHDIETIEFSYFNKESSAFSNNLTDVEYVAIAKERRDLKQKWLFMKKKTISS